MSEKQETIEDIVAEMHKVKGFSVPYAPSGHNGVWTADLVVFADRIEDAWRTEKAEIEARALEVGGTIEASRHKEGNAAAMREALEMMSSLFANGVICTSYANTQEEMEQIEELYRKAKAALSAPPRNCDRFSDETEAMVAFLNEVWLISVNNLKQDPFDEWTPEMKARYAKWLKEFRKEEKEGDMV